MDKRRGSVLAWIVLSSLLTTARAAEVSLPLTDDSWINGNQSSTNFGEGTALSVHNYGPKQSLFRFDGSAIAGKTVTQATLRVFLRSVAVAGQVVVFPVLQPWTEADVTWRTQPASESTASATVALTPAIVGSVVSIDVTSVVQAQCTHSAACGFLFTTVAPIKATIDSKERAGGTPATLIVSTVEDQVPDLSHAKVLDLSQSDACVIDEPGLYVLNQNWGNEGGYSDINCVAEGWNNGEILIRISANNVTLDFRSFEINGGPYETTVIQIVGEHVTLQNGTVVGGDSWEGTGASVSGGVGATLRNMVVGNGAYLSHRSTVQFSRVYGGVSVGDNSVIEASDLRGSVRLWGNAELRNNRIYYTADESSANYNSGAAIYVNGEGTNVFGNSVRCTGCFSAIRVAGSGNHIESNTMVGAPYVNPLGTGIRVDQPGNQIDSNTVLPGAFGVGIQFNSPGNFFGGNRCSAPEPFSGTAGQVDWGGNVGF